MRVTLQRVNSGYIAVNGEIKTSIQKGISLLIGFTHDDTAKDVDYMAQKCLNIRVFEDQNRSWNKSVKSLNYEVLCISQFTLYSKLNGNKPDFHNAMETKKAEEMYDLFVKKVRDNYKAELVKDGLFGLYRTIQLDLDGPVTINLESKKTVSQDQIQS